MNISNYMHGRIKESRLVSGFLVFIIVILILFAGSASHFDIGNNVKSSFAQPSSLAPQTCDPKNLTGKWRANDGGTYFVRHIGSGAYSYIWWFGARSLQEGTPFSNVFHGQLWGGAPNIPDGIYGNWLDVPLGKNRGKGELWITIDPSGQRLTKDLERGNGFSASEWIRDCKTLGDILKGPARSPFVK